MPASVQALDELTQSVSFILTPDNPSLFVGALTIDSTTGDLTFTTASGVSGTATITVVAQDNGGIANGGNDTSAPQTFTITIAQVGTGTTLTSSQATSIYGQPVTFTAAVAGNSGPVAPTGTVTFMDGTTPLGTSLIQGDAVTGVSITNGGSYTSAPTVTISGGGGTGATGTAILGSGLVTGVTITNLGTSYTSAPTVAFSGGGGSGAAGIAVLNGSVTGITLTNPGSGYILAPTITFSGGGGSGAIGFATIDPYTGAVTGITMIDGGTGYTSAPTVTFSGGGATTYASGTATILGTISGVVITSSGQGYTSAPSIAFSGGGGSGAAGTATIGMGVTGVAITSGGSGFTSLPTITFTGGGSGAAATAILSGVATYTAFTLSVAGSTHEITAIYGGDSRFTSSTSPQISQIVTKTPTTTTVISSANPSVSGQSLTITATVTPNTGNGIPTGTVTFYDNGTVIGTGTLSDASTDTATFTTSTLPTGTNAITATYTSGDSNFNPSAPSAPVNQVVNQANTTTSVVSSANPSVSGQAVIFTATVTINSPGSNAVANPTGTVTFYDNGVSIGTGTLSDTGTDTATFTMSTLPTGTDPITAAYTSGDSNFNPSGLSSAVTQVVNPANTTTTVVSSPNPSVSGQAVTFTATVTVASPGSNAVANPTGTVTFYDNGVSIGTGTLSGTSTDTATFSITTLPIGTYPITAAYTSGDNNFNPSGLSSAVPQVVNPANTTTTVVSSPNPSVSGQAVTFTATVSVTSPGSNAVANPTGTVTFYDNGVSIGTGTLSDTGTDTATCTTSTLPTGTDPITAAYTSGDSNFNSSTPSATFNQVVGKANTTTTVVSSPNPSVSSQVVTFTATVAITSPGSNAVANPTGTVTFYDNGAVIGTGTLSGTSTDTAIFTTGTLATGTHLITVAYTSGDNNFKPSSPSSAVTQVVNPANTTTTVVSSANPSVSGQTVTFTAAVTVNSPGSNAEANPTGTVTFYDNGVSIGTETLSGTSTDTATFTTNSLAIGTYSITAAYTSGDHNFNPSGLSSPVTQVVNPANTTTTVVSSANPSVSGQMVTFTATVVVTSPGSNAVANPTGTVTFYDNGVPIGTETLSGTNTDTATFTTNSLAIGMYSITAAYTIGDHNFNPSGLSSVVTQVVNPANTTTTVVSPVNPSVSGQAVTFTATVSVASPGSNAVANPTGTVTFYDNGVFIGTGTLSGTSTDTATFTTSTLPTGTDPITAAYTSGDNNFNPSSPSSVVNQVVNPADTTTTVVSPVNPSVSGQAVTFTATVTVNSPGSNALANPTGTVTFYDNGVSIGTGTLSGTSTDTATFTTSTLPTNTDLITAAYTSGDNNFNPSDPSSVVNQVVNPADTTTTVVSSVNPSVLGQTVTFTATVTVASPGSNAVANPTGRVTFYDNGSVIGTATLSGTSTDTATFTTSTLAIGTYPITAAYTSGDSNFNPSTPSAIVDQVVDQANTTTTVASSVNPSVSGQAVSFTATVTVASPGSNAVANPSGTVTFYDNGVSLGTETLSGTSTDTATFTTNTLPTGKDPITAAYTSGDSNFNPSAPSAPVNQVVDQANTTTTTVASSVNPSLSGQAVTFTATVAVTSPGSNAVANPSGTVTFYDNGVSLGTGTLSGTSTDTATFTTSTLPTGTDPITAAYTSGDSNFNPSAPSAIVKQMVNKANTTTSVMSLANPSVSGQAVTFTATVAVTSPGSNAVANPGGTVTFYDNGVSLGTGTLSGTSTDTAAFTTSTLAIGTFSITAAYTSGDSNFNPSAKSAPVNQVVGKANTTTSVVSLANPSASGQAVTFTATVSAVSPGSGTPTGTVSFYNGTAPTGTLLGTGTLSGGIATKAITSLSLGTHTITVVYGGNTNFVGSSNFVTQTVRRISSTALAASAAATVCGQTVTFTATVVGVSGAGVPTGTVTFKDGTTVIPGTVTYTTVNAYTLRAKLSTSALSTGAHPNLTAVYSGDNTYVTSGGSLKTFVVNKANTSVLLQSSAPKVNTGSTVTFTATVKVTAPE